VTLNDSILKNLGEIKENAMNAYADDEAGDLLDFDGNANDAAVPNQMFGMNAAPLTKVERGHMA